MNCRHPSTDLATTQGERIQDYKARNNTHKGARRLEEAGTGVAGKPGGAHLHDGGFGAHREQK